MARIGCDDVVLLTGFPSLVARRTCSELLSKSARALVHAVVRTKFASEAQAALDAMAPDQRARVNIVEGDAAAMDLGLSGTEFSALAKEVDRIYHAADVTYLGVERSEAERVNIGGAVEILEFAACCASLKCLVFYSTASVCGGRTGLVLEDDLKKGQSFRNVVEETKARAEKLMRAAMARLPIAVVRPTLVVGDSITGEIDRLEGPYFLFLLVLSSPPDFALPMPRREDVRLNLVPIDYVARASVAIGSDPRAAGRTFHIADPAPLTARRVADLIAQVGGRRQPLGVIPPSLTKALLWTPGLERFGKNPRAFLDVLVTPVSFSCANTDQLLSATDIRCPPFETYVERLVSHVEERLRERRERRALEPADGGLV